jgi:hypothetical protein
MTSATKPLEPIARLLAAMRAMPQLKWAFGQAANAPTREQLDRWAKEAVLGQGISSATLVEIVTCKNASGKGGKRTAKQAGQNKDECARHKTKTAFCENTATKAIQKLCTLQGVGVATASAVLSWCFPARYAVIDRRVWETLVLFGLTAKVRRASQCTPDDYSWYMEQVHGLCEGLGETWTPQLVDRWLYAFSKCHFKPEHFV